MQALFSPASFKKITDGATGIKRRTVHMLWVRQGRRKQYLPLWQSWEAKGQARHSAPLFFSPVRHRKNGEGENVSCLRRGNRINVPEAREAMDKFKMEAANDLRVPAPS